MHSETQDKFETKILHRKHRLNFFEFESSVVVEAKNEILNKCDNHTHLSLALFLLDAN